ncbi:DgyrCDS219 [Dimorphilus gyrociliatus]|nr:DgyrCDS219 [Dimorphilus gyrociliatus]
MLQSRDGNGSRMLSLITEQFLLDPRLSLYKSQPMPDKLRRLWDELACLWVFVVLNPTAISQDRDEWATNFEEWNSIDGCPPEDPQLPTNTQNVPANVRAIFARALDATKLMWDNEALQETLRSDTGSSEYLEEELTIASARVNALRCHGYKTEARRLAVAVVRGVKRQIWRRVEQHKQFVAGRSTSCECGYSSMAPYNVDTACMGNPLNPIGCLFDTLIEVCLADGGDRANSDVDVVNDDKSYKHTELPSGSENDSYLTLAVQIAIFGLGQQRMKYSGYKETVARQQEKDLIQLLRKVPLDDRVIAALRDQVSLMFDGGAGSALEALIHPDSAPIHYFAKFLFQSLLPHDNDLAFKVGIRALRLPPTETEAGDDPMNYVEQRQCELATALLVAANSEQLEDVLRAVRSHMHSPSQIFSLAQHAKTESNSASDLKKAALELGLIVLKKTKNKSHWRRSEMVRWVIKTSAPDAGDGELLNVGKQWEGWLTAVEACSVLSPVLMSCSENGERLAIRVAMQCAADDPAHCALSALTMCEKDNTTFSQAFDLVVSAANRLPASQLFAIARYLDSRNQSRRAYDIALLALKALRIAYNEDAHPAISDIHWTCSLAMSLGKGELAHVVPILVENVHCASVLSEILRRCTIGGHAPHPAHVTTRGRAHERAPLRQLLDAAICAYVNTTHSRLAHISPRHYADFVDFLQTAQHTFAMAPDGPLQFAALIDNMRLVYKGKKKLMALIKDRFNM